MSDSTPEQVEQQYMETMGQELGKIFYRLSNECTWLHFKWNEFVTLFGSTPDRIDLLNEAAGAFFRVVQDCLWEDILLHLARLTDSPKSCGNENLTVQQLPLLVDIGMRLQVEQLLKDCLDKCLFAKDWRNRHIAHRDLHLALDEKTSSLAPASRLKVKEALASIAALLNCMESHYRDTAFAYDFTKPLLNSESLLQVLKAGLDAEAKRHKRLITGTPEPEDLFPPPAI